MSCRVTAICSVIYAIILTAGKPLFADDAQQLYQQGLHQADQGDTIAALQSWSSVLELKPDSEMTQAKMLVTLAQMVKTLSLQVQQLQERVKVSEESRSTSANTSESRIKVRELDVVDKQGRTCIMIGDRSGLLQDPIIDLVDPKDADNNYLCLTPGSDVTSPVIQMRKKGCGSVMIDLLPAPYGGGSVSVFDSSSSIISMMTPELCSSGSFVKR